MLNNTKIKELRNLLDKAEVLSKELLDKDINNNSAWNIWKDIGGAIYNLDHYEEREDVIQE